MRAVNGRLLLLVASTVLCLAALEIWFRSRTPLELGFRYTGRRFEWVREFSRHKERNQIGFHDVEPRPKRPGELRVLLLGDSYVAGSSVSMDQIVGQRLEHHLNQGGDGRFDVISIGRAAWGQRQQLQSLRQYGPIFEPDLVVTLFLTINDVRDNYPPLQPEGARQGAPMRRRRPHWFSLAKEDAPLFWCESSALNQVLSYRLGLFLSRRNDREIPADYQVYAAEYGPDWQAAWKQTEALLLETRAVSTDLGAHYGLVSASTPQGVLGPEAGKKILFRSYPAMKERSWDLDKPDRLLAALAESNGIPFLALEPVFRRLTREEGRNLHWKRDGHWNREGNDEAGRHIARFILQTFEFDRPREAGEPGRSPPELPQRVKRG